eukprot:2043374-Karenia_brevis.AAC.1
MVKNFDVLPSSEEKVLSPTQVWVRFLRPALLKQQGTAVLKGIAPPGDLERELQKKLDNWE